MTAHISCLAILVNARRVQRFEYYLILFLFLSVGALAKRGTSLAFGRAIFGFDEMLFSDEFII